MEQLTENILDVTTLEPRMKHPTIFQRFDELAEGESLTIHNDHDPKPLYYQLLGERGNTFTWQYLEEGPEWWKVKISKRKSGESDETIGEMAAKDIRKAQIFKKYGLDFCCGGKKSLKKACAEKGLDVVQVEKELQNTDAAVFSRPVPYQDWDAGFLADYILNTHHTYVRKTLPDILQFARKVAQVHGNYHTELIRVNEFVGLINAELLSHMAKEEQVLFPFIKQLAEAQKTKQNGGSFRPGNINGPIGVMEMEHELVGGYMENIRELTNGYTIPDDACTTYTLLFKMLSEFEEDLHLHIHLENNILFPKAQKIEKELMS